jgi:hypothetical protein
MNNDMAAVIIPKSDQANADDFLSGPKTIKITSVAIRPGTEQPISVFFDGDEGKPWKPCKSMARVMVHTWGPDSKQYVGRSLTLYCDKDVKWGGMAVGGIRISHMTDIDSSITMALTATKGSRKPYTVKPLTIEQEPDYAATIAAASTVDELAVVWKRIPTAQKPTHEAAKDARKKALTKPAIDPNADFIDELNGGKL